MSSQRCFTRNFCTVSPRVDLRVLSSQYVLLPLFLQIVEVYSNLSMEGEPPSTARKWK